MALRRRASGSWTRRRTSSRAWSRTSPLRTGTRWALGRSPAAVSNDAPGMSGCEHARLLERWWRLLMRASAAEAAAGCAGAGSSRRAGCTSPFLQQSSHQGAEASVCVACVVNSAGARLENSNGRETIRIWIASNLVAVLSKCTTTASITRKLQSCTLWCGVHSIH